MPQILVKQPSESRKYYLSFVPLLPAAGEVVTGVTSTTVTPATGQVTVTEVSYDDGGVSFRASGGSAGVISKITFLVTTSLGNSVEGETHIRVKAI